MQSMMEVVVLVKVGVSGLLFHMDSSTDTTDTMMVGGSGAICHLDSLTALYHIINIVPAQ